MSFSLPAETTEETPLSLRLLGTFALTIQGQDVPVLSRSARALLTLLALCASGRSIERDLAATLLWPTSDEQAARYNLRRTLAEVRAALGAEADRLVAPAAVPRTLRLDLSGNACCDVADFDALIRRGDEAALLAAVRLYGESGPLLEAERGDWILADREQRRLAYLEAHERLAALCRVRGDQAAAIAHLRSLLTTEPVRETAVRDLMHLLHESGQSAAASAAYRKLRGRLRETAANPDPETTALYKQLWGESRRAARIRASTTANAKSAASKAATRTLPQPLTALVGRSRDRAEVIALLTGGKGQISSRLLTLTGAGGVGKTTLAVDIAEAMLADYRGGVYFIDLAPLTDPTQILPLIARTLEMPEALRRLDDRLVERVVECLRSGQRLLLLDNAEHLVADVARLARTLLRDCAGLTILATSREPLRVPGEIIWRVPGLAPADALHLFRTRTAEANSASLPPSAQNDAVSKIVTRLDGIPLAIEMAAARTRVLSVAQIAARLDDVFRLLTVPGGDLLPRHQTLRATLDWSYDLLGPAEQTLLACLSIFAGGWTLDAAEEVCPIDGAMAAGDVLDLLIALVEQSLVVYEPNADGEDRYRFLETTRMYAAEKLTDADRARLHTALLRHLLNLAETARTHWHSPQESEWLDRLECEWPNLQAALTAPVKSDLPNHTASPTDALLALRLAGTLQRFWHRRGYVDEGRHFLTVALGQQATSGKTEERAAALNTRGALANFHRDTAAAIADFEESLAIRQQIGNRRGEAVVLRNLGWTQATAGNLSAAVAAIAACIVIYRDLGETQRAADNERLLGEITAESGGNTSGLLEVYRSGLDAAKQKGDRFEEARYCLSLAGEWHRRGELDEAWESIRRGLSIAFVDGDGMVTADGLEGAAEVSAARGNANDFPLLYGAADRFRHEIGVPVATINRTKIDRKMAESRAMLGDAAFDAAWERGQSLTLKQAVAYVLEGG